MVKEEQELNLSVKSEGTSGENSKKDIKSVCGNAEKNYTLKCKFTSRYAYTVAVGSLWLYCQIKGQIPEEKKHLKYCILRPGTLNGPEV